jgi:hypothetical protein
VLAAHEAACIARSMALLPLVATPTDHERVPSPGAPNWQPLRAQVSICHHATDGNADQLFVVIKEQID